MRKVLLLAMLGVSLGSAQWVEDSIDVGGAWVGSEMFHRKWDRNGFGLVEG
jgi:hypothetical protein